MVIAITLVTANMISIVTFIVIYLVPATLTDIRAGGGYR